MVDEVAKHYAQSACEGKERFTSPAAAKKASKRIAKRAKAPKYRGSMLKQVESYRCPHCGGWHLGGGPLRAKR